MSFIAIVVEEAAEVLEAHIVTALSAETDHLILIGDHLQLRPNPSVYELAKKFNLEISLFERFKNKMEYNQLTLQHRMRPTVSSLLVPFIYKELLDHPSVLEYEDIKGISKNVFFIDHSKNEKTITVGTKTHSNDHEAEFIVELARYILLQGYEARQVTILCTYSGQLQCIKELKGKYELLKEVRFSSVDSFQGSENDIILLSFVRSNEEGEIGFLKDTHRINVALSRARKGLYCIGNFKSFAAKSPLWKKIQARLMEHEAIGPTLELHCQNHKNTKSYVDSREDFNWMTPDGGCVSKCNFRLPCGHVCDKFCHFIDREHREQYGKCVKLCQKMTCEQREHECQKICHFGEECGECAYQVTKIRPQCGHVVQVACSCCPSLVRCRVPCKKIRSCGHYCNHDCSDTCDKVRCAEIVEMNAPCGHNITMKCADIGNSWKLLDACRERCLVVLECGHVCKGSCGECKLGRLHIRYNFFLSISLSKMCICLHIHTLIIIYD